MKPDFEQIERAFQGDNFNVIYAMGDCHLPSSGTVLRAFFTGDEGAARAELRNAFPDLDPEEVDLQETQTPVMALAAAAAPAIPVVEPGQEIIGSKSSATLGCAVTLAATPGAFFLTAAHAVYGAQPHAPITITSTATTRPMAELYDSGSLNLDLPGNAMNEADCALGVVTLGNLIPQPTRPKFSGNDVTPSGAILGMDANKYGAVSKFTTGRICAYQAVVRVTFDQIRSGPDPLKGLFRGQVLVEGAGFADFGDSGSLVVLSNGNAVGILFAGTRTAKGSGALDLFVVSPMSQVRLQLHQPKLAIQA